MSMAKFNVFHWHLTNHESSPVVSSTNPKVSCTFSCHLLSSLLFAH